VHSGCLLSGAAPRALHQHITVCNLTSKYCTNAAFKMQCGSENDHEIDLFSPDLPCNLICICVTTCWRHVALNCHWAGDDTYADFWHDDYCVNSTMSLEVITQHQIAWYVTCCLGLAPPPGGANKHVKTIVDRSLPTCCHLVRVIKNHEKVEHKCLPCSVVSAITHGSNQGSTQSIEL
jgi:hypothetical protein